MNKIALIIGALGVLLIGFGAIAYATKDDRARAERNKPCTGDCTPRPFIAQPATTPQITYVPAPAAQDPCDLSRLAGLKCTYPK